MKNFMTNFLIGLFVCGIIGGVIWWRIWLLMACLDHLPWYICWGLR